ncbi:MAG: hypothetical protein A2148_08615 [Chloroflexi bacterium RBG_16_68_14]|nr:MAG: hypothetical protein A2148_08615 [Chloroflexi bacterium RBG_16_68_14]
MDTQLIQEQYALLERLQALNSDHVQALTHTPDWSEIRLGLKDVPALVGDPNHPRVRRDHEVLLQFDDRYPTLPPLFQIGPERPICAHIWRNRTICLLQHSWYPARELWTGVVDLVEMLQRGTYSSSPADQSDHQWLRREENRRRLHELVGSPTRFRLPLPAPAISTAPPSRPKISTVS